MTRLESERLPTGSFDERYRHVLSPVMMEIEAESNGTDYGSVSWSTLEEVSEMTAHLDLHSGRRLLDIGAGAGWPGVHIGEVSGCDVTLLDFPINGLKLGLDRAIGDGVNAVAAVADAAVLPFGIGTFDGVIHSDVLCCLSQKREVLDECRRVVPPGGRMAFTVLEVMPGLSPLDHGRGVECGPEYVDSDISYTDLLTETGWSEVGSQDLTDQFGAMAQRRLTARETRRDRLVELLGRDRVEEVLEANRKRIASVEEGLLRRCMYLAKA